MGCQLNNLNLYASFITHQLQKPYSQSLLSGPLRICPQESTVRQIGSKNSLFPTLLTDSIFLC